VPHDKHASGNEAGAYAIPAAVLARLMRYGDQGLSATVVVRKGRVQ